MEQPDSEKVSAEERTEDQKRHDDMEEFFRMPSPDSLRRGNAESMRLMAQDLRERRDRTPRPKAPWDSPYSYPRPEVIKTAERYRSPRCRRPVFDSPKFGPKGQQKTPSPKTRKHGKKEKTRHRAKTEYPRVAGNERESDWRKSSKNGEMCFGRYQNLLLTTNATF